MDMMKMHSNERGAKLHRAGQDRTPMMVPSGDYVANTSESPQGKGQSAPSIGHDMIASTSDKNYKKGAYKNPGTHSKY